MQKEKDFIEPENIKPNIDTNGVKTSERLEYMGSAVGAVVRQYKTLIITLLGLLVVIGVMSVYSDRLVLLAAALAQVIEDQMDVFPSLLD